MTTEDPLDLSTPSTPFTTAPTTAATTPRPRSRGSSVGSSHTASSGSTTAYGRTIESSEMANRLAQLEREREHGDLLPFGSRRLADGRVLRRMNPMDRKDLREVDVETGAVVMADKFLKQLCRQHDGYATPELNDRLYLHFKGRRAVSARGGRLMLLASSRIPTLVYVFEMAGEQASVALRIWKSIPV